MSKPSVDPEIDSDDINESESDAEDELEDEEEEEEEDEEDEENEESEGSEDEEEESEEEEEEEEEEDSENEDEEGEGSEDEDKPKRGRKGAAKKTTTSPQFERLSIPIKRTIPTIQPTLALPSAPQFTTQSFVATPSKLTIPSFSTAPQTITQPSFSTAPKSYRTISLVTPLPTPSFQSTATVVPVLPSFAAVPSKVMALPKMGGTSTVSRLQIPPITPAAPVGLTLQPFTGISSRGTLMPNFTPSGTGSSVSTFNFGTVKKM